MAARALPNLALTGFFDLGEDGWDDEMSLNLLKLSVLVQATALDKVAAEPGSPTDGDVYILDETHATHPNEVAIRDDGAWVYVEPFEGWLIFNQAAGYYEKFDGTEWAELATGGGGGVTLPDLTGNAGKFLKVNATEDDVEWADPAGGGSAWMLTLPPVKAEMPDFAYAQMNSRNMRPCVVFDTGTQETVFWTDVLPHDYGGGGIIVDLYVAAATATTGNIGWDLAFERINVAGLDVDSDSFATAKTIAPATVPATSGVLMLQTVTFSNSEIDGLLAGEMFRLRIRRDVANDTAAGDAQIFMVHLREA